MGAFGKWLMHDDQKGLWEILFACVLNIVLLVLVGLLLWPLGKAMLAFRLAQGYGILWLVIDVTGLLVILLQKFFGVNLYDHADAYVNSNLAVSCFLQTGWSAFAALTLQHFVAGASIWIASSLYLVGVLSCLVAFYAVSSFYQGHIYRLISLPLALISFVVFSVWPAGGRLLYGWFFNLFGAYAP
ncbi:MAG TPA: hypothetical protein VGB76_15890 [Pyrinomonadaceae bacterium]